MTQKKNGDKKKNGDQLPMRTRNFATVVYPTQEQYESYYALHYTYADKETGEVIEIPKYDGNEGWGSTPDDWKDTVRSWMVTALLSPMHIADTNPDGSIKKPHWHLMLMFDGVKNYETQVKPLFDEINAVGREAVNSTRGYARYLCHLDNPEKHKYREKDVECFGGADYKTITELPGDIEKQLAEIQDFIIRNDIVSYAELLDTLRTIRPDLWATASLSLTITLTHYLKSRYWERTSGHKRKKVDNEATSNKR